MFIPDKPRKGEEDWDLGDAYGYYNIEMQICKRCVQKEEHGIRSYEHGGYYLTLTKVIIQKLERKIASAKSLMERLQWCESSTCGTCKKNIDPEEGIVACVKCRGSMHATGCIDVPHDAGRESDTTYSIRVEITLGVCGACATPSGDGGKSSNDPILAPEQHTAEESSKKRKLDV